MTAIADIRAAIVRRQLERKAVPLIGRHKRMVVMVGQSAKRAIMAETTDHQLPPDLDGVPLISTDEFAGWEVSER